jgi:hypothetical protein
MLEGDLMFLSILMELMSLLKYDKLCKVDAVYPISLSKQSDELKNQHLHPSRAFRESMFDIT